MAEKIHPNGPPGIPTTTTGNPYFPANKAQLYNSTRPVYRPLPRRNRRSCCCSCFLWTTVALLLIILIAAIAGCVFYLLYRPHRPSFAVTSLQLSQFNLTSSNQLNTKFNFTVTARNPNKKITFNYDVVFVKITSRGVDVGHGTIPAFDMPKKNTTKLKSIVSSSDQKIDDNNQLKADLKSKKSLHLVIQLDTKARVKIGSFKSKKVPVRVVCTGVKTAVPTGKTVATATTSGVKCKVDLRIKIWKWTV